MLDCACAYVRLGVVGQVKAASIEAIWLACPKPERLSESVVCFLENRSHVFCIGSVSNRPMVRGHCCCSARVVASHNPAPNTSANPVYPNPATFAQIAVPSNVR